MLAIPDMAGTFGVKADASDKAIGAVLYQRRDDDEDSTVEVPIAFTGRKLNTSELNYPVREKEMLSIIHAITIWRVYLLDGKTMVETDHKSLEEVLEQKTISRRMARWYDTLAEFNIDFKYLPGARNQIADAISRRQYNLRLETTEDWPSKLREAQDNDQRWLELKKQLNTGTVVDEEAKEHPERWTNEHNLLFYKTPVDRYRRIVVPESARSAVLEMFHDAPVAGHPGITRTLLATKEYYYWPNMHKTVNRYVRTCEVCQRMKTRAGKLPGKLKPLEIPEGRWSSIGMDFVVALPKAKNGCDAIIVVVDRLTKRAHFIGSKMTMTAVELAKTFNKEIVRLHGLPEEIVSDRDSKFTSNFWTKLSEVVGVQLKMATAYHQRTDGQAERTIKTLKEYLRCYTDSMQSNWEENLAMAEFAYNNAQQAAIGMSPFEADLGYSPRIPLDLKLPHRKGPVRNFVKNQKETLAIIRERIQHAQDTMAKAFNQGRKDQFFQVGELVLVSMQNLEPKHGGFARRGLGSRFIGPYRVAGCENEKSYRLELPPSLRLHPVFHTSHLKPYLKDENREQRIPKVMLQDGEEGEIVDKVMGHRIKKSGDEYLIKWTGQRKPTWEPRENLDQIGWMIDAFIRGQKCFITKKETMNNLRLACGKYFEGGHKHEVVRVIMN